MRDGTTAADEPETAGAPAAERLARAAALLAATGGLIAAVWAVPYLPTNDGAQHVLSGFIQSHYADEALYRAYLEPLPQFAERGFSTVFVPLEGLLGWRSALRVTLSLAVAGGAWAYAWLVTRVDRRRWPVALLGFAFAFAWPLYMGFFSFVLATSLGTFTLGCAIHRSTSSVEDGARARALDYIALAALLLAQAVMHAVSAALTGLVLALVVVMRAPRDLRAGVFARTVAAGVPAMLVLAGAVFAHSSEQNEAVTYPLMWGAPVERLLELPRLAFPGPLWRSLVGVALVAASLALAARRMRRGTAGPTERALFWAAVVFLALGVLAPMQIPGWQFFAPRFLPMGTMLALALLPVETLTRRGVTNASAALFALTSVAASAAFHVRLARGCADTLSALDLPLRREWFQLPIVLDMQCGVPEDAARSEVPHLDANFHVGALYATAHGGLTPYLFGGNPSISALRMRGGGDAPPLPMRPEPVYGQIVESRRFKDDDAYRGRVLAHLAGYGVVYDNVVVIGGRPSDLDLFVSRGYDVDWRQGSLLVARFRGCPLDVIVARPPGNTPFGVEYGLAPLSEAQWSKPIDPTAIPGDGPLHVTIPRSMCGNIWVRVSYLGSSAPRPCGNANPAGRLETTVHGRTEITCDLPR